MFEAQTSSFIRKFVNQLAVCERRMEQAILKIPRCQKLQNTEIRKRNGTTDVIKKARNLNWK